jgi:hypothetical protein
MCCSREHSAVILSIPWYHDQLMRNWSERGSYAPEKVQESRRSVTSLNNDAYDQVIGFLSIYPTLQLWSSRFRNVLSDLKHDVRNSIQSCSKIWLRFVCCVYESRPRTVSSTWPAFGSENRPLLIYPCNCFKSAMTRGDTITTPSNFFRRPLKKVRNSEGCLVQSK